MLFTLLILKDAYLIQTFSYENAFKTLLADGLSTFFIKGNLVFSNGTKSLPKSPPYYPILCN